MELREKEGNLSGTKFRLKMLMKNKSTWFMVILDFVLINLIYIFAIALRFDMHPNVMYIDKYLEHFIILTLIKVLGFALAKMYKVIWEYASVQELLGIFQGIIISNIGATAYLIFAKTGIPRSIYPIVVILDMAIIGGYRFVPKLIRSRKSHKGYVSDSKRTMIVGAGESGILVLNELRKHPELGNMVVVFVDDDSTKHGKTISGIPVRGGRKNIPDLVKRYDVEQIIIAMPSVKGRDQRDIVEICTSTSKKVRIVPGMYEMIDDKIEIQDIRDIEIDDLLGREEVKLDDGFLSSFLEDKVILVTGGGGSIGSELCRQIVKYKPKQLLILDIYENNAYEIQNELRRKYPGLNLKVLIESIRDRERIAAVFETYKPQVVFHAAAHKHVPLMENSPQSAVKNNVFGTLNVVLEADRNKAEKFVMISTDKAVNPTNIMGTTKRICEMIVQSYDKKSETDFVSVRFGNVLGSNGSVIPLFIEQIREGGPLTVTDERIIRYFMSIPEASQLVLQAGAMGQGGEIFVLDMGEPVKIIDLAEKLIRLYGYVPYKDIDIEIIGLRPGEKLYEELLIDMSQVDTTSFDRIYIEKPGDLDFDDLVKQLEPLEEAAHTRDRDRIVRELKKIVPVFENYVPN